MQESFIERYSLMVEIPKALYLWVLNHTDSPNKAFLEALELYKKSKENASKRQNKAPKRTHPRLETFLTSYEAKRGFKYVIGDYNAHCGAAARTVGKVTDDQWAGIVDLYLSSQDSRVKQAGYPFHWLIHDLNRWFRESSTEKSVGWAQKLKDIIRGK